MVLRHFRPVWVIFSRFWVVLALLGFFGHMGPHWVPTEPSGPFDPSWWLCALLVIFSTSDQFLGGVSMTRKPLLALLAVLSGRFWLVMGPFWASFGLFFWSRLDVVGPFGVLGHFRPVLGSLALLGLRALWGPITLRRAFLFAQQKKSSISSPVD